MVTFVILRRARAEGPAVSFGREQQVLRFAQDDKSGGGAAQDDKSGGGG
jgi:hypothetical protein